MREAFWQVAQLVECLPSVPTGESGTQGKIPRRRRASENVDWAPTPRTLGMAKGGGRVIISTLVQRGYGALSTNQNKKLMNPYLGSDALLMVLLPIQVANLLKFEQTLVSTAYRMYL